MMLGTSYVHDAPLGVVDQPQAEGAREQEPVRGERLRLQGAFALMGRRGDSS